MMRRETGRQDERYFTRTASTIKAINLPFRVMRGGIRF